MTPAPGSVSSGSDPISSGDAISMPGSGHAEARRDGAPRRGDELSSAYFRLA